jgi:hypothetical protein
MMELQSHSLPNEPTPFPVADDRRATVQAMNAWSAARGGDDIPELSELFDGSRQLGDSEFLIKVDDDAHDSVFIVFGSDIVLPEGERGAGRSVSRVTDPALRNMFRDACAESVSDGVAIYHEGMIRTESDTKAGYRCNFMPVRSGYEDASMYVFGAFGIKVEPVSERNVA